MNYRCPLPPEYEKELWHLLKTIVSRPNSLTTILSYGEKIKNPGTGIHGEYVWLVHWKSIEVKDINQQLLFKSSAAFLNSVKKFSPPTYMSLAIGKGLEFNDIKPRQVATMLLGASILIPTQLDALTVQKNIIEQSVKLLEDCRILFDKEKLSANTPSQLDNNLNNLSNHLSSSVRRISKI